MASMTESVVEEAALAWLESTGWRIAHGPDIAPDMPAVERADYGEVVLEQETVWLTQRQMAELFDSSTDNELEETATTENFSVVQTEGKKHVKRRFKHYNLDAIISVGYRVNSRRGVRFRQWATRTPRDHLLRGYMLNERRLRVRDAERFIGRVS